MISSLIGCHYETNIYQRFFKWKLLHVMESVKCAIRTMSNFGARIALEGQLYATIVVFRVINDFRSTLLRLGMEAASLLVIFAMLV
jgi:hypothetical protein